MPKKQKNIKRLYIHYQNKSNSNLILLKKVSTLLKINKQLRHYQLGIKYLLPGYATHEYEIQYQFRRPDKLIY